MHPLSRTLRVSFVLALAGLAAACATTDAPVTATAAAPAATEEEASTGTRLGQPASYHMLRRVGAAGAREMMRDKAPASGPKVQ